MPPTSPAPASVVAVVPLEGRGRLPFVELHREPLLLHAVRALLDVPAVDRALVTVEPEQRDAATNALRRSGLAAEVVDAATWWAGCPTGSVVLAHDPLCPLVPAAFLADCLADWRAAWPGDEAGGSVLGFRPVTDTLKSVVDDQIVGTLDRDRFAIVTSPVVLPGVWEAGDPPPVHDFAALAAWLRSRGTPVLRKAPSLGRRVDDPSAVNLLECMDDLARSVRER